jgi:hypothetical protein
MSPNYFYSDPQQINQMKEPEESHSKILYILEELLDNRALEAYTKEYSNYLFALSSYNKTILTKKFFTYAEEMMTDLEWRSLTDDQERAMIKILTNKPPDCLARVKQLFEQIQSDY